MVGIDLGTRILKVNISKVRKDINPIEDVEAPLDPVALLSSESARTDIPVTDHASSLVQSDGAQIGVEGFTYSSYAWQPVMTGKIVRRFSTVESSCCHERFACWTTY